MFTKFLFVLITGILSCWVGIILYIIAMVRKSKPIFLIGLILEAVFITSSSCSDQAIFGSISAYNIVGIVFFALFSVLTYYVIDRAYRKDDQAASSTSDKKPTIAEATDCAMICPLCGQKQSSEREYCISCGANLK